jgi:hypothetical protein
MNWEKNSNFNVNISQLYKPASAWERNKHRTTSRLCPENVNTTRTMTGG